MTKISNGNVFLTSSGFNEPPKVWSSFKRAELEMLNHLRDYRETRRELFSSITCVQADTNLKREVTYSASYKPLPGGMVLLKITRDVYKCCGCHKVHIEALRTSLDY
jgi:hypothetical protein